MDKGRDWNMTVGIATDEQAGRIEAMERHTRYQQ
jgi:hypothetical protein